MANKKRSKRSSKNISSSSNAQFSGLAITALIGGILSTLLFWVPILGSILSIGAFVLGIASLIKISKDEHLAGKGMGITGIILGSISFVLSIIVLLSLLFASSNTDAQENEIIGEISSTGDQLNEHIFDMNDAIRKRDYNLALGKLERANLQLDKLVQLVANYERFTYEYRDDDRVEKNILNYNNNIDEQRDNLNTVELQLNSLKNAEIKIESIKAIENQISNLRNEINLNLENNHEGSARANIDTYISAVGKYREYTSAYLAELNGIPGIDTSEDKKHFDENIRIYESNIYLYNANLPR